MTEHLEIILKKQFEFAGHLDKYDSVDFKDKWYSDYTWTKKQEEAFEEWVINYLSKNIKARREVCTYASNKTKKYLNSWFSWWNLMYGFKIRQDDTTE